MPKEILKKYFGHSDFRKGQEELINEILSGRDVLGIMPTGSGKSLCFQVPALMFSGICLVVSPLISLMQDQVKALLQVGVRAAYINSSLSPRQIDMALHNAKMGVYKIIYVAPERLLTENFLDFARNANISMLAVDEAHCISKWGQDFRPSYSEIPEFVNMLPKRPVLAAFTATATEQVENDIIRSLKLRRPLVSVSGFDRENLYFQVEETSKKMDRLLIFLAKREKESGIIYCATRKTVEQVYEKLSVNNFSVLPYHAGLPTNVRKNNQDEFIFDRTKIMVATNAFGMGIDKSNVNFVVHYNMPKDMESYYQEAGRAGRDGTPAHCLMLYSAGDMQTNQFLIEMGHENDDPHVARELIKRDYERLYEMNNYAHTRGCLRRFILNYFGDKSPEYCGNCSNCNANFKTVDVSEIAFDILDCVLETGGYYGKLTIIDLLRGSKNKKLLEWKLDRLIFYGKRKESKAYLSEIFDQLIEGGFLSLKAGKFQTVFATQKAADFVDEQGTFKIKVSTSKSQSFENEAINAEIVPDLFDKLRKLRAALAKEQGVPAFVIFSDASLKNMCQKLPTSMEEFLEVSGVGQAKKEKYGEAFVKEILEFLSASTN